ncbi:MAG TPA: DUF6455 family protein [Pelomicrobium sp.]|nr:DUF6455 family protein [Pelomicrobium sp.]
MTVNAFLVLALLGVLASAFWWLLLRQAARATTARPPTLFARMREHLGIDLARTPVSGAAPAVAEATERCGRCTHPAECREWLATDKGSRAPGFCVNATLLAELQEQTRRN